MSLKTRIDRLAVIVAIRYGGDGQGGDGGDMADDPHWMATARCMGVVHLRKLAAEHPSWDLARTIAAVDEWERTVPKWWLEGPFGQKRWRYGVRQGVAS